jgi:hypothetical protein
LILNNVLMSAVEVQVLSSAPNSSNIFNELRHFQSRFCRWLTN